MHTPSPLRWYRSKNYRFIILGLLLLSFSYYSLFTNKVSDVEITRRRGREAQKITEPRAKGSDVNETEPVFTRDVYVAGHSNPHPEICPSLGANLRLLILVTSAPLHRRQRDGVRLTWGHYAARRDIAFAFVLGALPAFMQPIVEVEDALYGDIIIGHSLDSYSNLPLKTLSMLEWVDTFCPRVPRLLKTDDDVFINVPKLLEFIDARKNTTKTIWGYVWHRAPANRDPASKYYMPVVQYPFKVFPDYVTGPAYLLTSDCVRPLLRSAGAEPYLRLEDVFVTGMLAGRLGLRHEHVTEFYTSKVAVKPCALRKAVAIHDVQYHEQFDIWSKLLDGKAVCHA